MKQRGFTLIELMIVITILGIVAAMAMGVVGASSGNSNISWGINGMTEMRCIDGYKFVIGEHGNPRQVIDEFGKGAKCESASVPNGIR